ncbi:MAG: hypothetical protein AAF498_05330 [Pseudomonadota bacterium]
MSEQLRALLPRFDVADESDLQACPIDTEEDQTSFEVQSSDEGLSDDHLAEEKLEVPKECIDEQEIFNGPSMDEKQTAHLQTTLDRLTYSLESVERSVHEQATSAILHFVQQAFPKLADMFLAEEVARHIADIVPVNQPNVIIKTAPFLIDAIKESLARNGGVPGNCKLMAGDDITTSSVDIYWEKGGASTNYDAFLDRCLQAMAVADK